MLALGMSECVAQCLSCDAVDVVTYDRVQTPRCPFDIDQKPDWIGTARLGGELFSERRDGCSQVLTNILGNAIKFTDRGEVILKVSDDPASDPGSAEPDGARLHFSVCAASAAAGRSEAEDERPKFLPPTSAEIGSEEHAMAKSIGR